MKNNLFIYLNMARALLLSRRRILQRITMENGDWDDPLSRSCLKAAWEKWVDDVEELAKIAKDEPQAVYASFTKAVCHRWTYVQRTIPNIEHLFVPLEDAIREKLIPAIIGRKISNTERRIFGLPVRYGGMGIRNPSQASHEFESSTKITDNLTTS